MFLEPVDEYQVIEIISKFKPKMSYGYDDIPTKIMKQSILSIIQPLTYIINKSLEIDVVPNKLKIAKVILIFKSSKKAFSKVFEKIIVNKLWHSLKVRTFCTNTSMALGLNMQPFTQLFIY